MKFASQLALILAASVGLNACSGDGGGGPSDDSPTIATIAIGLAPEPPAGRVFLCPTDGSSTTAGPTCPVLIWNDITYWPLNYTDGRNSVQVIGFNSDKEAVKTLSEKVGTKNIWQITINESQETVTLRGAGDATVTFAWSELPL